MLDELKQAIDAHLETLLPRQSPIAQQLLEAMRYAATGSGKRLRPMLTVATATGLGASRELALPAACAVELVHCYSLVHDDLPAMDDDELRHGKPSTHIAYGEANAILTGDALLTFAFQVLSELPGVSDSIRLALVRTLSAASGWEGMVGGQVYDMWAEESQSDLSLSQLQALHGAKSGALIRASVEMGARLAEASEEQLVLLREFADRLGLAFQIADDVIDATESTEHLGKPAGSDAERGKVTFVSTMGLDQSKAHADQLLKESLPLLDRVGLSHQLLHELADRCVNRSR